MKKPNEKGWLRPGMRSSDYGIYFHHDHDYRTYSGMNYTGLGPKGYRRPDNLIEEEVCELLKWDTEVDASEIEVFVQDGLVNLKGSVDSRHAKRRAENILDHVKGVIDIQNGIYIKPTLDVDSDKIITRGDEGLFSQEITQR